MNATHVITAAVAVLGLSACGEAEPAIASAEPASEVPVQPSVSGTGGLTPECRIMDAAVPLPMEVSESSGLAQSRRDPSLFWTHNDAGNEPYLFAIDATGKLVERVRIAGAESIDWEDIESAHCGAGDCLYIADIGDNDGDRPHITLYRVAEPAADAAESAPAEALHMRYPDGPRDAESLFILPSGDIYLVTKGRDEEITLYRHPGPYRADQTVTLERVVDLFPQPDDRDDRVTSATTSPDGRWVGIRSYQNLYFYRADDLTRGDAADPFVVDLTPLREDQGEAVVISDDGSVWLSSEAEDDGVQPRLSRLQCSFPEA